MTVWEDIQAAVAQAHADYDTLGSNVTDLSKLLVGARADAEILRARLTETQTDLEHALAEIAVLQAELMAKDWSLVYSTTFAVDDGWTRPNEVQKNDASRNLPRNVTFGPDGLRIVGRREDAGTGTGLRHFTSGEALGRHVTVPNYFRAEVVGRGPHARGLWPCVLWFRPLNSPDGEIDLVENFGAQPNVKATLHNQYGAGHKMIGRTLPWERVGDPAGDHTYVIEKTPGRIVVTVDGLVLMDVTGADAPDGFDWARIFETPDRTWYPRVTLQVGVGASGGATGMPADDFTETDMVVTSLRVWSATS